MLDEMQQHTKLLYPPLLRLRQNRYTPESEERWTYPEPEPQVRRRRFRDRNDGTVRQNELELPDSVERQTILVAQP